jgi:hypothetical protein
LRFYRETRDGFGAAIGLLPAYEVDYGHRMTEGDQQNQNPRGPLIALAAVAVIFVLGLLLFRTLYASRRLEDCLLSGRTNCAPIESPTQ